MIDNSNEIFLMDDANSPEADKKLLGLISQDFVRVSDQLKEASYQIRTRGFSTNPIFVATKRATEIGILLIANGDANNELDYRASFIDEFIQRGLVAPEAVEMFKENYKIQTNIAAFSSFMPTLLGLYIYRFPKIESSN